jgi:hypothetical protein
MPAVVTYWQLPEDEKEFLDFLLTTGKVVAMPDHWVKTTEELAPQSIDRFIQQHNPDQLKFGLERHPLQASVEAREFEGEVLFGVPVMKACVIGYSRGRLRDGNNLTQSNLAAYWDYPNEDATRMVEKDAQFINWAKRVFAWVRKATSERLDCHNHPYRATKRVKNAMQRGQLEVVLY